MKQPTTPKRLKLEDEAMWRVSNELAEYFYGKLHEFPEEEKWVTERKLRACSNDLLFGISQALGNPAPSALEYDWAYARKNAAGLKTMYRFAYRQKMIELEPAIMVKLDKLITQIDDEVAAAYRQTAAANKKELEFWQEKYHLGKGAAS